jgi:glycogen debranching enzyme
MNARDTALTVCESGQSAPMGAHCTTLQGREGVNFAVHSHEAERVEVCLYDASGSQEIARLSLPGRTGAVWHGFVPGITCGQLYGLRAHGSYRPASGQRFNPAKLLIDPFARALEGPTGQLALERDYMEPPQRDSLLLDVAPDPHDNAVRIPKARVLDLAAELQAGAALTPGPQVPLAQTVLYEAHVKGLTQRHPDVPPILRGSYAGLASAPLLAHYRRLGITTLCLLPVQLHVTEAHLLARGLRNYWGYNTLGYFVPEPGYASGQFAHDRAEFRHMVDALHRNGLEVVLDVVYNHSAEGDTFGPTLSWRGLDNASWYALDEAGQYLNFSGCGNSFNLGQPCARTLVLESLRWWVQAFGVDGFRFDLASALGRGARRPHRFEASSELLRAIALDPVLARVKCIAEPWDLGPDGYQLGQFPSGWHEWNDRFRDSTRAFWLGFDCTRGEFARRFTASSDRFEHDGRSPLDSVNLITAHDGMTLADLTSCAQKHNCDNDEDNRDGRDDNFSANAGVEGPTTRSDVLALRAQWRRALLTTLLCAQGLPQLLAGDEFGHSQRGNNNAYCQDNELSWLDWEGADHALTDFVASAIRLRHDHAALRHARWFDGGASQAATAADIRWRNPDGSALTTSDWDDPKERSLACLIEVTDAAAPPTERWLLLFHPAGPARTFHLPPGSWRRVLDSAAALALPLAQWASADICQEFCEVPSPALLALVQIVAPPTPEGA